MKKLILAAVLVTGAVSAQAGVHFSFGIGIPAPVVVAPAYAPVYVAPPPPVYYAPPRPVYYAPPPPVYYAPPRPIYYAPPRPVVVRPPVVHFGFGFGPRQHQHRYHGCR